jgi:cysteine desulfurase
MATMRQNSTVETPVYLDYNASTPLDARVFDAMRPWFLEEPGNAGSRTHVYGQRAKDAVEKARQQVAELLAAEPEEIIFTSGATESNNAVILGLARYGEETGRKHVVATAIEHKAVLEPVDQLRKLGFRVDLAPVTVGGYVDPDTLHALLRPDTLLVSVMHANNETGVLQPVREIAELLVDRDVFFQTDAAQTFGKEVESLRRLRCDFLSISAHKIYGPKGVGALYVRKRPTARRPLAPLIYGGGQERGLRPGTLPVPLAVGLGEAAALAAREFEDRRTAAVQIKQRLLSDLGGVEHHINGDLSRSQPHVLNVSFPGVDSEALMMATREIIAISNGSACTSTSYKPSHVLQAMGLDEKLIESAVRISWGPGVDAIPAECFVESVRQMRL